MSHGEQKGYIIAGSRPVADTRIGRAVTWWRPFFAIHYLKYVWIANFGTEYNREQIPWAGGEYPAQAVQTF